ncbi:MAG TPA: hypothetical protein VE673_17945 [Pseudonocardiaceae bacterium]|nr:hypothetical protein [Pseudonocardiaceae bacterium]
MEPLLRGLSDLVPPPPSASGAGPQAAGMNEVLIPLLRPALPGAPA